MTGLPFDVPEHEEMILKTPGKRPGTVLAIERQLFNVKIAEYTEPLFFDRQW